MYDPLQIVIIILAVPTFIALWFLMIGSDTRAHRRGRDYRRRDK
jgi:hypothetical protein